MALNIDQLNTDTRKFYDRTLTDQVHDRIPLIHKLRRMKRVITRGGTQIQIGLKYARNTQSEHYTMGSILNSGNDTKRTAAVFDWRYKNTPIKYTGEDEIKNQGDTQIFDTVSEEIEAGQEDCMEYLSDVLFESTSPGTDTSAIPQGLNSALDLTSTYGEITRSSTVNAWWRGSVVSTGKTVSLAEFRSGYQTIAQYRVNFKNVLCITTKSIFQKFQALLQPHVNTPIVGEMAKAGFRSMSIDGIEIVIDDNVPDDYFYMLDLSTWQWRINPVRDFKLTDFKWQGENNNGTDEYLARILLAHNWVCNKPRANQVWTSMT